MPIVMVRCSNMISEFDKASLARHIQIIVAEHLDVPKNPLARLRPADVEVNFHSSIADLYNYDIQVTVFATKFEERVQNIGERSSKMAKDLKSVTSHAEGKITGFFYVCLVDAGFSEF